LRVIDTNDGAGLRRHDHGARDDWPGDGPTTYFVDSREQWTFLPAKVALDRRPARPFVDAPAADGFWVRFGSFGGRVGSRARFDLVRHPATLSAKRRPLGLGPGSRLRDGLGARHQHLGFALPDARGLAGEMA